MGKNKLERFAAMETYPHVFQTPFKENVDGEFELKGRWRSDFFKNENPIVLELGCGKGEYSVGLGELNPEKNFIGIDIKGARMHRGATDSLEKGMTNVAFLRTKIEMIDRFFEEGEVDEIWVTFPDPQMKKFRKRLTSTRFLKAYKQMLKPGGLIHLKTDSNFLFTYTQAVVAENKLTTLVDEDDLYNSGLVDDALSIQTFYESQFLEKKIPIKYICFKLDVGEFIEPDIEIEFDDYRSYNRGSKMPEYRTCGR